MSTRLDVPGTYNFRDYAGFSVAGGSIPERALFRADALHRLHTPAALTDLGIRTVVDLRDDMERSYLVNRVPEQVRTVAAPVFPSAMAHVNSGLNIHSFTEMIYQRYGTQLVNAVTQLADADSGAVLFHCTAGKDRTGAVAALTLLTLGADRDDVLEDYAQSETNLAGEWLENHLASLPELDEHTLGLVSLTPASATDQALRAVEQEFGSIERYLTAHGMTEAVRDRLRARFVTAL